MADTKNTKSQKQKSNNSAVLRSQTFDVKPYGIVVCENGMVPGKNDYALKLTKALSGTFNMLPPINSGRDIWGVLIANIPSVIIISQTLRDVDAINLINLLKMSNYCDETMFFLCVKKVNKSVRSVCEDQKIDGVISFTAALDKTADEIVEKYYSEIAEKRKSNYEDIMKNNGDINLLFDIERSRFSFDSVFNDILVPIGMSAAHKGTEYACLIIAMKMLNIDKPLSTLYELTALYFNTTAAAVEKSIRYALERAWTVGNLYMQQVIFGNTIDESKGKPTNSEFIARIYEYIRQSMNNGLYNDRVTCLNE